MDRGGGLFLRDAVQKEPEMLRHSRAVLRKAWLEEHAQVAGLTGQQDKALLTAVKNKMFWDRSTTASSGPRQPEQKGRQHEAQTAGKHCHCRLETGQGGERPNTKSNRNIAQTGLPLGPGTAEVMPFTNFLWH